MRKVRACETEQEEVAIDLTSLFEMSSSDDEDDETKRRLANREIVWNEEISEQAIDISLYIQKWNAEDANDEVPVEERKPIKIFINSNGGFLNVVLNVIDMIQLSKTPVYTIGMGSVYSAAMYLLMSGHRRYIFPHTYGLLHKGSSEAAGDIGKIIDALRFTERCQLDSRAYVLSNSKITPEEFDKNADRDWFMSSDEMIKYGVADKILDDIDEIL